MNLQYQIMNSVVNIDDSVNSPVEFLDSLDLPGMAVHVITLKIGVCVVLLWDLNPR